MASRTAPSLLLLAFLLLLCFHIALSSSSSPASTSPKPKVSSRKALLPSADEDPKPAKVVKKKLVSEAKNQTKLLKPKKPNSTTTTATKMATTKTTTASTTAVKSKLVKVNKTASAKPKSADSTKLTKLAKVESKTKPAKPETTTQTKKTSNSNSDTVKAAKSSTKKVQETKEVKVKAKAKGRKPEVAAAAMAEEAEEDLISEFRGLPARLQETLMPDLARLSSTSKAYLSAANAGIAEGVRPLLGGRWAPVAASAASVVVLLLPLCLLTALVRRIGPYLPLLRRALVFAQAYLAIYFATLAVAAAATGLEPLRFFHAASPTAYAWTQAAQSLGYVAYLVLQMVDLVAVFSAGSTENRAGAGEAAKALGLAQMVVGLAVGLHYYAAVFHRAAAGEAPRANWRVHAVYAACFVVVCACARAERRKKAYLDGGDGGVDDWKKS